MKRSNVTWWLGAGGALLTLAVACSSDDSSPLSGGESGREEGDGALDFGDGDGDGDGQAATGGTFAGFGGAFSEDDLEEEVEEEDNYRAPVVTGRYLWSANPESGRVALIDAVDLTVRVVPAGLFPTYLAAVPGSESRPSALVINVGSSDVTRFVVDGSVQRDTAPTHVGANRWSVSSNWAVAYSVRESGEQLDPTEGLQEITVLDLSKKKMAPTRLTVGYRPSQVVISSDESQIAVVSEEGITIIDLTGDEPEPGAWVDLGFDAERRDVSVSSDGNYALVRRTDETTVDLIDLRDTERVTELSFSGPVTDVDLSETGRAVAVIRAKSEVATFLLADVLEDATDIHTRTLNNQLFGSVTIAPDGESAVVYTNVVANDVINVVDLSEGDDFLAHRQVRTQSPVYSVTPSPDGDHAVVLSGDGAGNRATAFAVVSLDQPRFPRIVGTDVPVDQVAMGNDVAIVTAAAPATAEYEAHLVELPSLRVRTRGLSSQPLSAGVLPTLSVAFAAQAHPEGRVTFFDFTADQARTLTGFELSAEVVDE